MSLMKHVQNHKEELLKIARNYGLKNIRIFGSVAKSTEDDTSDIDFLVDTEPRCTLLEMGGALVEFEACLGRKVDIVTTHGLKKRMKDKIINEAINL